MTLQWIPLDQLQPHPENSNRMPARLMEKLRDHIQRTGLYEPLVVRPINRELRGGSEFTRLGGHPPRSSAANGGDAGLPHAPEPCAAGTETRRADTPAPPGANPQFAIRNPQCLYQILNGHHRAEVLRQLGHTHARCDVWVVSDEDALVLLATLNRLEGRDDPAARARLVAKLAGDRSPEDLARLLPEPADAIERLMKLAEPPPAPLAPADAALAQRPMTFFLTEEQHAAVTEALREVAREPSYLAPGEYTGGGAAQTPVPCDLRGGSEFTRLGGHPPRSSVANGGDTRLPHAPKPCAAGAETRRANTPPPPGASRADALERLALWYLEARNKR